MTSKATNKYAPEERERVARMVLDHEKEHMPRWAAVVSIAGKIAVRRRRARMGQEDRDRSRGPGRRADRLAEKLRAMERENR